MKAFEQIIGTLYANQKELITRGDELMSRTVSHKDMFLKMLAYKEIKPFTLQC